MVALFLVIIAGIRLKSAGPDAVPEGKVSAQSLGICRELTVTGQVYKKDDLTFYLQDVSVSLQSFNESEDSTSESKSYAGSSRQIISCKDNIICKLEKAEEISLGSYVALKGSFAPIASATNPGEFDAAAYYQTIGVGGRLNRATLLGQGSECWPVREWLYEMRLLLEARLYRTFSEEHAGIMCALLLGDRGGLEERVEDLYRQSGILHILSISSLHITILGLSLYKLLRYLRVPVGPAAVAGCLLLLLYGCLTGFGVSACRAIGMYLIRMLGEVLGRTYDMLTALGVVGAIMIWQNPYYLQHTGFLLSFSSVLGVGVLYPALQGMRKPRTQQTEDKNTVLRFFIGVEKSLQQSALASLSVVLATLPVQLWCYYEVPVYSVFINLLVLPFVKPLMLTGFLAMLLPGIGLPAMAAGVILGWYEWLCGFFVRLPFHTWNPGCPNLWQIGVYYLILGVIVLVRKKIRSMEVQDLKMLGFIEKAAMPAALICAVLLLGLHTGAENRVTFLDVGQGDCIFVQTASGENYLFDCGSTGRTGVGEYVLVPFLKYHGIQTLDAVFVSHPDADHANGITELLSMGQESGVEIRQLILPDIAEDLRREQLSELIEAARTANQNLPVGIRFVSSGDTWNCGTARFTCLHPTAGWNAEDANAYSECFYVEFLQKAADKRKEPEVMTMLLTGDVEGKGEGALLEQLSQRGIGQVDVLKVAHHGSGGSTSEELLELIQPRCSVISCGKDNRYGHPHPELLQRLEDCGCLIYQTQESGAVTVRVKDGKVSVEGFGNGFIEKTTNPAI